MFRKHKFIKQAEIKSEPYDPKFFAPNAVNQSVSVNVTIEQDDGIAEAIKGCFSCCAGAAKTAAKA